MQIHDFYIIKGDRLLLKVKVTPGASKNEIIGIKNGELIIRIKAVPDKGKANKELTDFLSRLCKIPKLEINLVKGPASHHKTLSMPVDSLNFFESLEF